MNKVEKYIKTEYKALNCGVCVILLFMVMMLILSPYPCVAANAQNPVKVSEPKKIKGVKKLSDIRKEEKLKGVNSGKENKSGKSLKNSGNKLKEKKLLRKKKEIQRRDRNKSEVWINKKGALDKRGKEQQSNGRNR